MIADDKQRIPNHFEQSKFLIFQKFLKNFSTEMVKATTGGVCSSSSPSL